MPYPGEKKSSSPTAAKISQSLPLETKSNRVKDDSHELFGIWKDNEATTDVDAYVRELRKARY